MRRSHLGTWKGTARLACVACLAAGSPWEVSGDGVEVAWRTGAGRTSAIVERGRTGTEEGWYEARVAERAIGRGRVLLEAEGPGVVTAIDVPRRAGLVQVFVDGGRRAVLTMESDEGMGKGSRWSSPDGEWMRSRVPVTFSGSVRVVAEHETRGRVAYRSFEAGSRVKSATAAEVERLLNEREDFEGCEVVSFSGLLVPTRRESASIDLPGGPRRVREMTLVLPGDVGAEAVESIEVVVVCDGLETIRVPAWVLFDEAREGPDGVVLSCRWAFGYGAGCQVGLVNGGGRAVGARLEVVVEACEWRDGEPVLYGVSGAYSFEGTGAFREVARVEGRGLLVGAWAGHVAGWRGAHVEVDGGRVRMRALPVSGWGRSGPLRSVGMSQPFERGVSLRVFDGEGESAGGRFAVVFYGEWGAGSGGGITSRSGGIRRD